MDKTETVSIIAICKDGGTKLVEYKGRKYHVDYRINSETSGRVYDDYPNRGNIISDHELEKEIQLALRDLLMKTETKEMEGEFEGHTPGAWYLGFNLTSVYSCDNPKYIANVNGRNSYEAKQNAKLIAAAPDLLKENQSLRSELQKAKEENEKLHKRIETDWYVVELRKDLEKAKELNGELVKFIKDNLWANENDWNRINELIKKSNP